MNVIMFKKDKHYLHQFLKFPSKIYTKDTITQDIAMERELLCDAHVLSSYFTTMGFLVLGANKKIQGRCIVTLYPNDPVGYIGLFDCVNDTTVSNLLFGKASSYISEKGRNRFFFCIYSH